MNNFIVNIIIRAITSNPLGIANASANFSTAGMNVTKITLITIKELPIIPKYEVNLLNTFPLTIKHGIRAFDNNLLYKKVLKAEVCKMRYQT